MEENLFSPHNMSSKNQIIFPESHDELIELINGGGRIADSVTLPDGTLRVAVFSKGTDTDLEYEGLCQYTDLGYGGLCQYCGEFFHNWKQSHELRCKKNPSPDTERIEMFKASERERQARRGNCSVCGKEFSYNNFMRNHKKKMTAKNVNLRKKRETWFSNLIHIRTWYSNKIHR